MRRRDLLTATLAVAGGAARAATPTRVVALEWSIVSMLLSLGVTPVGVPEIAAYGQWVARPPIPAGTRDVGVKSEPNFEAIAALTPDLILTSPLNRPITPLLERIAPVREVAIYTDEAAPVRLSTDRLRELGDLFGRSEAASAEILGAETTFANVASALVGKTDRPVVLVAFLDTQHVRVFGPGSLFGDVLNRVGLTNGWTRPVNLWGFTLVGLAELASLAEARLLVVEPIPVGIRARVARGSLWSSLPAVRAGRVGAVPAAWQFGDLTAARLFASFLPAALAALP